MYIITSLLIRNNRKLENNARYHSSQANDWCMHLEI